MTAGLVRAGVAALSAGLLWLGAHAEAEQPTQSPTPAPASRPAPPRTRAFAQAFGQRGSRLFRTPDMYGDFFSSGTATLGLRDSFANVDLPPVGGGPRTKVCETNRALPTDRAYFLYDHYHNALDFERVPGGESRSFHVDRFTIAMERTFQSGCWSVEGRLPFTTGYELITPADDPDLILTGGEIGNLSVIFKRLVYRCDDLAVAVGAGLTAPTGSDVQAALPDFATRLDVHNDAVYLYPFVGLTGAPTEWLFYHAFTQVDFATQGNLVTVEAGANTDSGRLNDPALLYVDVGGGVRVFDNDCCSSLTGIAVIGELHYTRALQDPDRFAAFGGLPVFRSHQGSDFLNVTTGLHFDLGNQSAVRVAGVFPVDLDERNGRLFDAEVKVAFVRRF